MLLTLAGTIVIAAMIAVLVGLARFAAVSFRAGRPVTGPGAGHRATLEPERDDRQPA